MFNWKGTNYQFHEVKGHELMTGDPPALSEMKYTLGLAVEKNGWQKLETLHIASIQAASKFKLNLCTWQHHLDKGNQTGMLCALVVL